MFTRKCFTYIPSARWEKESAIDGFFATFEQFVTLETSSLTSCIFSVDISFRNPSWLNIVIRDATSVVCPYAYMAKCAIAHLVVIDEWMCSKPISFLFSLIDKTRHKAHERCGIIVSLRPQKLLLTTLKQCRLLMLLLTTVKQRTLLMLLLTMVNQQR